MPENLSPKSIIIDFPNDIDHPRSRGKPNKCHPLDRASSASPTPMTSVSHAVADLSTLSLCLRKRRPRLFFFWAFSHSPIACARESALFLHISLSLSHSRLLASSGYKVRQRARDPGAQFSRLRARSLSLSLTHTLTHIHIRTRTKPRPLITALNLRRTLPRHSHRQPWTHEAYPPRSIMARTLAPFRRLRLSIVRDNMVAILGCRLVWGVSLVSGVCRRALLFCVLCSLGLRADEKHCAAAANKATLRARAVPAICATAVTVAIRANYMWQIEL